MVHNDKVLDDVNALLDYNAVKDYLFMTVINAEENKNDLTTMPHTIIGDLAIVYKVMIKTTDERFCAAKVTNQLMDAYGIDVNKLHNDALISSPNMMKPEILPLETMLMGIPKDIALEEKEHQLSVNKSEMVDPDKKLSDHLYHYDKDEHILEKADDYEKRINKHKYSQLLH